MLRNSQAVETLLNSGVNTNGQDLDSSDLLIIYDLEMFYQEACKANKEDKYDEVACHSQILMMGANDLFKHPLTELLLHLKWCRINRFFVANLLVYIFMVLSLTTLAIVQTSMELAFDANNRFKKTMISAAQNLLAFWLSNYVSNVPIF